MNTNDPQERIVERTCVASVFENMSWLVIFVFPLLLVHDMTCHSQPQDSRCVGTLACRPETAW